MNWMKTKRANGTLNGYPWGSPEHTRYIEQANKDVQKNLEELGLIDDFYSYWFDEPYESDYDYVIVTLTTIKHRTY